MPKQLAGTIEFLTAAAMLLAAALPEEQRILVCVRLLTRKRAMLIKILGEDRYWVDERHTPMVARMGCQLVEAIRRENPLLCSTLLHELVQFVYAQGQPVPREELAAPDLEIPPPEWLFPAPA